MKQPTEKSVPGASGIPSVSSNERIMEKVDLIRDLVISENDVAHSTEEAVPADEETVSVTRDEQEMEKKETSQLVMYTLRRKR